MVANYYTLGHLALQLNQQLNGSLVREVFSQNKSELVLSFDPAPRAAENSDPEFLVVRCEPSENCLFLTASFSRAKKNSVDLIPGIVGLSVQSVSLHNNDRQLAVAFTTGVRLVIQMFGSKANVLLVDSRDVVLDSFLRSKEVKGRALAERQQSGPRLDRESFSRQLKEFGEISIGVAIKKFFPRFGGLLLTELFYRAGITRSETVDRLSDDEVRRLFQTGEALTEELLSMRAPRIYFDGSTAIAFSIIELHHCRHLEKAEFSSISEAIRVYLGKARSSDRTAREKARLESGLTKELGRISRTFTKISEEVESANRAQEYEMKGELLKAHLHELTKGSTQAIFENAIGGTMEPVTISLDKNLTPAKNADRYFEKAKRTRIAEMEKNKQKSRLEEEKSTLTMLMQRLETTSSTTDLNAFIEEHGDVLRSLGLVKSAHSKKSAETEVPFRVFRVAGDFVVWAGKSGENNDLLSTRYTKSKDLWFHARAVGGSHVVLKFGTGKGEISKRAIDEAAAIAAFYSKMKNSKLVPVSMCEGKYVRKPKGAPAGTVTIDREKVVFVEPRLPLHP